MNNSQGTRRTEWSVAIRRALIALGLVAGITGSAMASEQGEYGQPMSAGETARPTQHLSMEQIVARLKEQGFKDIYEVERERGAYEVKAHTPEGGTVKLYVDPRTGDVLRDEFDD